MRPIIRSPYARLVLKRGVRHRDAIAVAGISHESNSFNPSNRFE
jgi:hypothetical protein